MCGICIPHISYIRTYRCDHQLIKPTKMLVVTMGTNTCDHGFDSLGVSSSDDRTVAMLDGASNHSGGGGDRDVAFTIWLVGITMLVAAVLIMG